ncbi:MAG: NADP-dependent phosphogluconate dehydrogenase, partial [Thermoanaerobaculia bacterium]
MQFGMIGLGRMGAGMVRRLMQAGHTCVVYDRSPPAVAALEAHGATGSASLEEFVQKLEKPRHLCLMVPAAYVDSSIASLEPLLSPGDTIVDGGNSHFQDDIARAKRLAEKNLHHVDMGTSGGVWGFERGYCLMIGGEREIVARLDPVFSALAPGRGDVPPTPHLPASASTAEQGYLHCGANGAGHFVKMIHNGIEYGLMAAYAEGFNILQQANLGSSTHALDAETTPLAHPEHYRYEFDLPAISELWRRGSV